MPNKVASTTRGACFSDEGSAERRTSYKLSGHMACRLSTCTPTHSNGIGSLSRAATLFNGKLSTDAVSSGNRRHQPARDANRRSRIEHRKLSRKPKMQKHTHVMYKTRCSPFPPQAMMMTPHRPVQHPKSGEFGCNITPFFVRLVLRIKRTTRGHPRAHLFWYSRWISRDF